MASRIKGITVEIGGDTTKLDKALSDVNKNLGNTQRSLKDVERLLKLDPKNVILLEQKQRLLSEAVNDTSKKLEVLKTAAEQAGEALAKGAGDQQQYDALQREIADTERKLKDLEAQQDDTADSTEKLGNSIEETESKLSKAKKTFDKVTTVVATLGAAAVAAVEGTEDFRDGMSKLQTTAKYMSVPLEAATEAFKELYRVSGDTDASYEAVNNLMNMGVKAEDLAWAVDLISGAVIRFPDTLKIESLADSLQETVATGQATGQFAELLDRLGISAETVNESLAIYGDTTGKLDVALSYLASSGLAQVNEAWAKENEALVENRDAKLELQEALAELAEKITPLITKVTNLATAFLDWFNGLDTKSQGAIVTFGLIVAAIGPVIGAIESINGILPTAIKLFNNLDGKTAVLATTLALLATLIVGVTDAWGDMSTLERVVAVLGILSAAAGAAAIAVGALQSAWSLGIAAAAIVAGVVAITAAINSAKKDAEAEMSRANNTYNIPALAEGAVLPPNKPFLAMVGDQRNGTNIEAPMSTIKQGMHEVMNERGGSGGSVTRIEFAGSLAQLGRVLRPVVTTEAERVGGSMRK